MLIALTIFGVVMVNMGVFAVKFTRAVGDAGVKSTASDLAVDRLESVKAAGRYDLLETTFNGTETAIPNFPRFTRTTLIKHIGGQPTDSVDYKIVTVSVLGPKLTTPVTKSTIIGSF